MIEQQLTTAKAVFATKAALQRRWMPWALAAITVCVLSFELGSRELSTPDETRYAAISWSMLETGDWLTPTHNLHFKHWHKPPLTYWLMAGSFAVLGQNDWAARVPSALAALAAVLGVYVIGRTMHGPRTGCLAGLVLLSSPLFFTLARLANTDMLLCAFIVWTWVCFVRSLFGERRRMVWFVLGGVFAGLGFMTKGPVMLMSTLIPMLVFLALTNQWRQISVWSWLATTGVFLIVALPWYVIVSIKNPGLLSYFLQYQTVQRLATDVHNRTEPFWYFFVVVPIGFLPWTVIVPYGIWTAFRGRETAPGNDRASLLLPVIWFGVLFVFITVSTSKLPTYCLPLFPALALLLGQYLRRALDAVVSTRGFLWGGLCLVLLAALTFILSPASFAWARVDRLVLFHLLSAVCFLICGAGSVFAWRRGLGVVSVASLFVGMLSVDLIGAGMVVGHEDELRLGNPGNELAALIQEREQQDAGRYRDGVVPVMYRRYLKELPYYLGTSVLCLDCDVEFDYTKPDGTKVSFYTDEELEALQRGFYRWNGRARLENMLRLKGRRLLVVTDRASYEDIRSSFMEDKEPLVYFVAEVGEFVLCSNHPDTPGS